MGSFNDESLIQEFICESRDHLASIEPDLLTLEKEGLNAGPDLINHIFRAIHSIKGASGFFGFDALKNLSHVMESVLMMIRDGELVPTPEVTDPLLVGVDRLRAMLDDVAESESVPHQDVIERLEKIIANKGGNLLEPVKLAEEGPAPVPEHQQLIALLAPDRLSVESASRQGQSLYVLKIYTDADLAAKKRTPLDLLDQLISLGVVLDTAIDTSAIDDLDSCLSESMGVVFLYATVLEADLVAQGMDIPQAQVFAVNVADFSSQFSQGASQPVDTPNTQAAPLSKAEQQPAAEPAGIPHANEKEETAKMSTPESVAPVNVPVEDESATAAADKNKGRRSAAGESTETVRVKVDLLNRLMDLAGEMVLSRNQLIRVYERELSQVNGLASIIQNVDLITTDLQEHIMQTRMQSISGVFGKFPRVVRDMSQLLGKEIELAMFGEEVELDKSILESLSDPLTHIIRNCCDHAIEFPEERERLGKPRGGTITLRAFQESGQINIAIQDDGRGINHEKIARKAISSGMVSENEVKKMTPQEQVNLIFLPGLSTAEKVSDISGRGVGMDVVRTNIEALGGNINIDTTLGKGTTILLRLPLTLAIIPSLIVGVSEQKFAIPQVNLVELVCIRAHEISTRIEKVGSVPVLRLRGKLLPLVRLADILGLDRRYVDPVTGEKRLDRREEIADRRAKSHYESDELPEDRRDEGAERRTAPQNDYNLLVLKIGNHQYGLIVDEIFDMEEIVVKPLSGLLKNCKCFSGATIMGDGRVAMILDANGIATFSGLSFNEVENEEKRRKMEADAKLIDLEKRSLITFNNAENETFAIPLESVLRLEKFSMERIERVGRREFITYRGSSLPLIRLEEHIPVQPTPRDLEEAYLIIPRAGNGVAGIITSRILDTIETHLKVENAYINHPGVDGIAIINDHHTLLIDPEGLLDAAGINCQLATV
jgi:two-component system chemotaxis sensor kinase CheA